jgi:cytochrome d ubiquinol oxidase subunit I
MMPSKILKFIPFVIALPYIANSSGWILTEVGRQPWIIFGYLKTSEAVSPNLTVNMLWMSLIGFTLIYGVLMAVDIFLLKKYAMVIPGQTPKQPEEEKTYWD